MYAKMTMKKEPIMRSAVKFAKVSAVLLFFCFAECAAGSCLSYGHACWGAHGKRSGGDLQLKQDANDARWFISRLIPTPYELRLLLSREFDKNKLQQEQQRGDIFPAEAEPLLKQGSRNQQDEWEDANEDTIFDKIPRNKLKHLKILEKRAASKLN